MLGREALVAEVLAELVDALEAADDQALEVQLGGDAQVQVAVERVVVGGEGARQRAAVQRLQDGRLDLDEALAVEVAAHRGDDPRAVDEQPARVLAGDQVELAPAVARLDVAETVVLVGRRAQRLGEDLEGLDAQRELAVAAAEAAPSTPIRSPRSSDGEPLEELRAEHVDARVQLDLARCGRRGPGTRPCRRRAARRGARRRGGVVGLLAGARERS